MSEESAGQNAEATAQAQMAEIASGISVPEPQSAGKPDSGTQVSDGQQGSGQNSGQDMRDFIAQQNKQMDDLRSTIQATSEAIDGLTKQQAQEKLDAAVDRAVSTINDGVDGNAELAEAFLNSQYQKNADLQKIFDNREANPEALDKALGVLKSEWKAMNTKQIDPQVAENQRALQESQQSGRTPQGEDPDASFDKMSDGEFLQHMQSIARS